MIPGDNRDPAPQDRTPAPVSRVTQAAPQKKHSLPRIAATAFVIPGLFCTVALPAYASFEVGGTEAAANAAAIAQPAQGGAQSLSVAEDAQVVTAGREVIGATTMEELEAQRSAQRAAEARRRQAAVIRTVSGPSVADFLASPPYPGFDLGQVVAVSKQYIGVPYVYGGASPSGFDCSGFTQYVYAQFGVSLPHSSTRQWHGGTAISEADALPGDLVVMDGGGHIGIYLGNGKMIDAPRRGTTVQIRPIYDSTRYFVRYGI